MVDFNAIKSHVNSSLVQADSALRLDGDARQADSKLKVDGFFGRVAKWIAPGTPQATTPAENTKVKMDVIDALSGKFSDGVMNQLSSLIDWAPDKPLTSRNVRVLIDTAEKLVGQAPLARGTSNHGSAHFGDGNRLGNTERLGAGAVNEVFVNTWLNRSEARQMVFKPVGEQAPENFTFYGIRTAEHAPTPSTEGVSAPSGIVANGNIAGRNVASYETAHALGMPNMITETLHTQQNGVEGIIMGMAQGTSVFNNNGRISVPTALTLADFATRQDALNFAVQPLGLEVTGLRDGALQLERAGARQQVTQIIDTLRPQYAQEGIAISDAGTVSAMRGHEVDPDMLAAMSQSLAQKLDAARAINVLPLDTQQRVADAGLNLQLNQMQWLDFICGQVDRNPANIFIQYGAQGEAQGVTGIDNDTSFGERVGRDGVRSIADGTLTRNTAFQGLPDAVDTRTADAINRLSSPEGRERYGDMLRANKLTEAEVAQALTRLDQAAAAVAQAGSDGKLLPTDSERWATQNTTGYSAYFASAAGAQAVDPRQLRAALDI
ncbi:hypothetical protein ACILG0_08790 [Pseudomonadota bacterium AL_CKDN230030165-1A_HGKHYDSX7]